MVYVSTFWWFAIMTIIFKQWCTTIPAIAKRKITISYLNALKSWPIEMYYRHAQYILINVYVLYLSFFFIVLNIYFHLLFILVHPQYIISYFVYFCPISVHYFIFWLVLVHPKYTISSFVCFSPTPVHYHNQFFIEHEIRLYASNALKSYWPFIDSRLL